MLHGNHCCLAIMWSYITCQTENLMVLNNTFVEIITNNLYAILCIETICRLHLILFTSKIFGITFFKYEIILCNIITFCFLFCYVILMVFTHYKTWWSLQVFLSYSHIALKWLITCTLWVDYFHQNLLNVQHFVERNLCHHSACDALHA
jgi:hypothetical protein